MAVKRISPKEAHALLGEGYTYLDVRSVPEFDQGHAPGAKNAPLLHMGPGGMTPNPDFLAVVGAAFPKDAKLVVACKAGGRSQRAAMMMEAVGFSQLVEMRGGWSGEGGEPGWSAIGLPSTTNAEPGGSWDELKAKK
jgi:rhodanese-related sulfurtransferase